MNACPSFYFEPYGRKSEPIPVRRASSLVSELTPVVLYLRYLVRPGDVLITEEPESHLHPAMQAEFAKQVSNLACKGVRVVITTHSEWMLEQFTNLVQISKLNSNDRQELDYESALTRDQFGAWLFQKPENSRSAIVQEIDVNAEDGGLDSVYEDVRFALYDSWSEINTRTVSAIEK